MKDIFGAMKARRGKSNIAYDAARLSTAKIITSAISLVTGMLLSRFRTLAEYGTYSQMLIVINLFVPLFMLGLPNSANYFLARANNDAERRKFLSVFYTLSTIMSFVLGAALLAALPIIIDYFDNPLIESFAYFLAAYPWTRIIASSLDNVLVVYKRSPLLMAFKIANSVLLLLIILLTQWFELGFSGYMLMLVAVEAAYAIAVYAVSWRISGGYRFSLDRELVKKILKYSIPIGLATVAGTLKIEMDKLLIGAYYATEELAIYTNAAKELPLKMITDALTAVLIPQMARLLKVGKKDEAVGLWNEAVSLSFLIMSFFAMGLIAFAPEAMTLLYSEKYVSGASVFAVYAVELMIRCTYFGMALNATGKTRAVFVCAIISLGSNVALNFAFYYLFGFIGPAIATVVSSLISASCLLIMTCRQVGISGKKIMPWASMGKALLLNAALGAVFYGLKLILPIEKLIGQPFEGLLLGALWGVALLVVSRKFIRRKWNTLKKAGSDADTRDVKSDSNDMPEV